MKNPKLLFVCLGNICRSPTAEAVAAHMLNKQGLNWPIDSAGTSDYHNGEKADPRSIEHARLRGYDVTSISRPVVPEDFAKYDYILAMDEANFRDLNALCPDPQYLSKIILMTDYCSTHDCRGVPDPYYGDKADFEKVIDILEDAVDGMIQKLKRTYAK